MKAEICTLNTQRAVGNLARLVNAKNFSTLFKPKCDYKFNTRNHERVHEMSVPGTHRTMYLFLRRKGKDEFKVQIYEAINPAKAREGVERTE